MSTLKLSLYSRCTLFSEPLCSASDIFDNLYVPPLSTGKTDITCSRIRFRIRYSVIELEFLENYCVVASKSFSTKKIDTSQKLYQMWYNKFILLSSKHKTF